MTQQRLKNIVGIAYERLRSRINGGRIRIDNEASMQLHLGGLLKDVGELYENDRNELFSIELEKAVSLENAKFGKSGSSKAKVDIYCAYKNQESCTIDSCAIELKYFKRANHREPNNRYDVFSDIQNLESYGGFCQSGYLFVATDHDHYVSQDNYSAPTRPR